MIARELAAKHWRPTVATATCGAAGDLRAAGDARTIGDVLVEAFQALT